MAAMCKSACDVWKRSQQLRGREGVIADMSSNERLTQLEKDLGVSRNRRKITLKVVFVNGDGRVVEDSGERETPAYAEFPNGSVIGVSWPKGQK
jgi:hypothetical protein